MTRINLPFLPISLASLSEARWFVSDEPRVVRAGFWMLDAAWRSVFPGSIQASFDQLAQVTRLPIADVEKYYEVITSGWVLREDGRLHHPQLEDLAESLQDRFESELAVFAESAALACQGGTAVFELMPGEDVKKKKRGKTAFPRDFSLDQSTLTSLVGEGYKTKEHQDWLVAEVRNYALADDKRQSSWQAVVRKFAGSKITRDNFKAKFCHALGVDPSRELDVAEHPTSLRQRLAKASSKPTLSFAQMGAAHNSNLMAQAARKYPVACAPGAAPDTYHSPGMSPS